MTGAGLNFQPSKKAWLGLYIVYERSDLNA